MGKRFQRVLKCILICLIIIAMIVPGGLIIPQKTAYSGTAGTTDTPVLSKAAYRYIVEGESYDFNILNKIAKSSYVWKSSNTKIAEVNKLGLVTAKSPGTATISCDIKAGNKTYRLKAEVYVKKTAKATAGKVNIINKTDSLVIGDTYNLNKSYEPDTAKDYINWTSGNNNIATVDKRGFVKGIKAGVVTITAETLYGKVKDSVKITVSSEAVADSRPDPLIPSKVTAAFGSPYVDGNVDPVWSKAAVIVPKVYGRDVDVTAKYRLMWDDNALYVLAEIKDSILDKSSGNSYEQDSLELFMDELYDRASSYQADDVHYRVNFDNMRTYDAGDRTRFYSKTVKTEDGYMVEACITWGGSVTPANGLELGFDVQINAAANGVRDTTITIFDTTGNAYQNPSLFGKLVLEGKGEEAVSGTNPYRLLTYIESVKAMYMEVYANKEVVTEPLAHAEETADDPASTQEQIDAALTALMEAVDSLYDDSGFTKPGSLPLVSEMPDIFTMLDGTRVTTPEQWEERKQEIAELYQYYMYGTVPDATGEVVTYDTVVSYTTPPGWYFDGAGWKYGSREVTAAPNQKFIKITVSREGRTIDFVAAASFPAAKKTDGTVAGIAPAVHAGGYPVLIEIGSLGDAQKNYLNDHGYAVIEFSNNEIAADDLSRTGDFYTLYPYGESYKEQTGVLLAWAWGVSKIIDVLEKDAAEAGLLGISPVNTMVNGVSRNGKSAAVAGAFDSRIRITVPSSSGAGGLANFRYSSSGRTYDYSSLELSEFIDFMGEAAGTAAWQNYQDNPMHTVGANEALTNLQSGGEGQWFNDNFQGFTDPRQLPFDQHYLVALATGPGRYYYMTSEVDGSDWLNAPGMYVTYLASRNVFDSLGLSDSLAIHYHSTGHAFTLEDTKYLVEFANKNLYGQIDGLKDLDHIMDNTIFSLPVNNDPYFEVVRAMGWPDLTDSLY